MGLQLSPIAMVEPTACSCNVWFRGSFCSTVGQVASTGLEEEMTALVGAVAGKDF